MKNVRQVTAYKTSDKKLFTNEQEAQAHQTILDFKQWYLEHKLYGDVSNPAGSCVECEELIEWLRLYHKEIANFLAKMSSK